MISNCDYLGTQVLFKNLSVDMKDVKPSSLLKDRIRQFMGNPDFSNKDVSAPAAPAVAEVSSGIVPSMNHAELQPEINSTSRATSLPNMLNQVGLLLIVNKDFRFLYSSF